MIAPPRAEPAGRPPISAAEAPKSFQQAQSRDSGKADSGRGASLPSSATSVLRAD